MTPIPGGLSQAQLGQTKDPKALVPGNPEAVLDAASALVKNGERMEGVGQDLGRIQIPGWTGEASNAFWNKFSDEKPKWFKGSDALGTAAGALNGHADVLSWAQTQAREAIDLWEKGEAATRQAVEQHDTAVEQANAQAQAGQTPPDVPPFSDPGDKLRQEAQELLNRARGQLDEAGIRTAESIGGQRGGADPPSWLAKVADVADTATDEHGLGNTNVDLSEGFRGKQWGNRSEGGGRDWKVMLGEVSDEAYLWDGSVSGETELAGATLAGEAGLKTLGAEGKAGLSVTGDGLTAEAKGGAYLAKATAAGTAQYGIVGAGAKGQAYAGAEAGAHASVGTQGLKVGAEAFAGAKAEGSVHADVAGVGAGVKGEAWAGVGASADATVGMDDGKFTIGGELGAGLGVGGKVGFEVTVDAGEVVDTVGDAADAVGDAASSAADAVGDVASSLNPF